MNILVVSSNYPSKAHPSYGAFVYNLMQELATSHRITIISPYKIHYLLKKSSRSYGDEKCEVIRPKYLPLSNRKILGINFGRITANGWQRAVVKSLRQLTNKPDIIYVHFLYNAQAVLQYAKENDIPLVVASGESTYTYWNRMRSSIKFELKDRVKHIICVSQENRQQLLQLGFEKEKINVIPNAVNYSLFRPLDKDACREKLGIDKNKFIVGFIGHFIHRKGPNRIIEAIETLNDKDITLLCVGGKGELMANNFTTEISPMPNSQLPILYNTFDVFVLPTLREGHCNVIEEAKACAIPIVSSKGTSVEEQIDESIGILIDPMNIKEIASAISLIKGNRNLHRRMVDNLIKKRGENSIQQRAGKIEEILFRIISF